MSCYMNKMEYKKHQPKWDCEPKYEMDQDMDYDMDCCDMDYNSYPKKKCYSHMMPKTDCMQHPHMDHMHMDHMHMGHMGHMGHMDHMHMDCCEMPMTKCKTEKTCVKTYKCTYKLYKVCSYKLYKVCPRCGHEYDYYRYPTCTKCR